MPISTSFRLALAQGLLVVAAAAIISTMFYFGTVGVLSQGIEAKYVSISNRLIGAFQAGGRPRLQQEIQRLLDDGIDSDTEVYLLTDAEGHVIGGNVSAWPLDTTPLDRFTDQNIIRAGRPSTSRLLPRRLSNGDILVVGRDMADQSEIASLVWKSIGGSAAVTILLAIAGATAFRRQVDARLAAIRRTARQIVTGDMSSRIPPSSREDEFARLSEEINQMLDRIHHLMDGTIRVSNAIAHDLRTPLSRIRGRLDEALRMGADVDRLSSAASASIAAIDDLIGVFDKLLTIAEAEAGTLRRSFGAVALAPLVGEVVELYDAMAEEKGVSLTAAIEQQAMAEGDKDLLGIAVSNLVDNALKYAGKGAHVRVGVREEQRAVSVIVADDGPGIPAEERTKVLERFYRLDEGRSQPGNGLGLSLVAAIVALHHGKLMLEDAAPGLLVRVELPRYPAQLA